MNWAILATGPSMSQAVADSVRGRCQVIAVSDAYKLAPWADLLVSSDRKWWDYHRPEFAGKKLSAVEVREVERFTGAVSGENSGLLAIRVAVSLGATRVLLCGFDMGGTHFFGPHHEPRWNTTPQRYERFKQQFANFRPKGVEIINCTEGSALTCYPMAKLEDILASLAEPSLHVA